MLAWLRTKAANERASVPCPFCRRTFCKSEVIHIVAPPPAAPQEAGASGAGPATALAAVVPRGASDGPRFTPAATDADVAAAAEAAAGAATPLLARDGHYPAVPRLFLTHLAAARATRSSKLSALLSDLLPLLAADATAKAVVFSQLPSAVTHVATALRDEGVGAVRLLAGMPEQERRAAIERFNGDASVRVFVLHVGAAAAGLTLTVASTLFMLEPFLNASDEAQARNRCHRIGQTRPVRTFTYYAVGTVEERLLAYRAHERGADAVAPVEEAAVGGAEDAAAAAAARRKGKGKARAAEEEESDAMECGAGASTSLQPRRGAAAPAEEDALATLAVDTQRSAADGDKLRFLFGLAPRAAAP
jgi:E3 ubiquitin-protein ligase SHPRH